MAVNKKLNQQGWVYDKAQTTMIKLGAGVSDLGKYKALTKADVAVSTAVMKPNMSGQRDAALAWFWTIQQPEEGTSKDGELLKEGEIYVCCERTKLRSYCGQCIEFIG